MSLAEQLRQLQIPGQAVIQQISSKSFSLLFDSKTAASLDNEAICNIGLHGYEELRSIDPAFDKFRQLFDSNSIQFQRNLLDEDASKKVSQRIQEYLILLTPYLLLKPAQKTLEWLIRRYQCHVWDKEALIACILPFHESLIFGRIIQLFGINLNNDQWDWLVKFQKEGTSFSTQSLISFSTNNKNLLSFFCKMADDAKDVIIECTPKSELKIVFSFHARMMVAIIEGLKVISEDFISFLLPHIHSGLKSKQRDYACSTYMIITALASKSKLMKDVTKAVLASILKSIDDEWYEEGFLCFLSILQLQNVKSISNRIFKLFHNLNFRRSLDVFIALEKEHEISMMIDLLIPLLCKCAVSGEPEESLQDKSGNVLKNFLDYLELSQKQVSLVCHNLIGACIESDATDQSETASEILVHLSKSKATIFDESIGIHFEEFSSKNDKEKLEKLKKITMHSLSSEKHCVYGKSDVPLLLSLNHPDVNMRIVAVQELFTTFKSDKDILDKQFFTDAVIARLDDDETEVVKAVLKYPKSIIKILEKSQIQQFVLKLMQGGQQYNLNELTVFVMESLSEGSSIQVNEFVYSLLGQLLVSITGKKNKKLVESLSSADCNSDNVILKGISKALSDLSSKGEHCGKVIDSLLTHVRDSILSHKNKLHVIQDFWNYLQKLPIDHHLHISGLLLLIKIFAKDPMIGTNIMELNFFKYLDQCSKMESELVQLIDILKDSDDSMNHLVAQYVSCLNAETPDNFPVVLNKTFFSFLFTVNQGFINNQSNTQESVLAKQKFFNLVAVESVNTSSKHAPAYRILLNQFLGKAFLDASEMMTFLCTLYMKLVEKTKMDDESFKAAICSLHITKSLLSLDMKDHIKKGDNIVCATHICLLTHPLPIVRNIVLDNISILANVAGKVKVWGFMLKKIKENFNEIMIDPLCVKRCWQSTFIKRERKLTQFDLLIQKSKKDDAENKNISVLHGLIRIIPKYPLSLQVSLLQSLELVDSKLTIEKYVPILQNILEKKSINEEEVDIVKIIIKDIKSEMFDSLKQLFPLVIDCLKHCLTTIQAGVFELLTPAFYNEVSSVFKNQFLQELLNLLLVSESITLSTDIRVLIKSLDLDTENVASLLGEFCDKFDIMYTSASSNRNVFFDLEEDDIKMPMWRTLSEILDATSHKETKNPELLVPSLFRVFERCLKCNNVDYAKQLLLQSLLMVTRQDISKLSEDQFQIELLIQCLQSSTNMHTNQQCLLVLSNAARFYPTRVLHNVMHIFSFMGGTMLRLDNAYSFEIMEKTIDAVIPVLIQKEENSSRKRPAVTSVEEVVNFILQTFIDSIPHCPEHRRQHIIKHLVKLLQPTEYLHMVMTLLLKKAALQSQKQASEEENMELSPISFEFCKDLYSSYSIPIQVHSLYKMVAYLTQLGVEAKTLTKKGSQNSGDIFQGVSNKQAFLFKCGMITFILEMLRNGNLEMGYDVKPQQQDQLTQLYLQLIEELLSYSDKLGKTINEPKTKNHHIQSLQYKVSEVISQLYDLLPFDSFIKIVSQLLFKDNELMRKKSLELLCKKLGNLDELSSLQEKAVVHLFKSLVSIVKHKEEKNEGSGNKQLILYAIKLIAIKLCKGYKDAFLQSVPVIAQLYSLEDSNEKLSINAMLCVAELCSLLKAEMLPYLPIIMKPLFTKLTVPESHIFKKGDPLIGSYTTVLHTILKAVPLFLSPYISGYLFNVASYDAIATKLTDNGLTQKITSLKEDMGKFFPPRVLFPAVKTAFKTLLETKKEETIGVIDVYRHSFKSISKADANSNFSADILDITKSIFDVRSKFTGEDDALCDKLEHLSIEAFKDLILKLTENTLRPMYLDLLNWSVEENELSFRLLSFYRLSVDLSKSLKSLFLLFVGHVLKNSNELLTKISTKDDGLDLQDPRNVKLYQQLLIAILGMLSNCFFYDSQGFINKERFESMLQTLVDQMENKVHGDDYISFAKEHFTPCIVNFAAAVNDAQCWKQLNHQILLKTKSEDEHVRLISLYVIEQIYSRLGESYMILIPETIPFLAEILEDVSVDVEKQCQKVIQAIENISGESIQKYF